ncbi:response regulator transcription factor [Paenibacillus sp. GCM10027627]|uniref:response regulator transcription factor n=1 Tax=unclassified Paenibacillus TaxID=185978 RepID=UPI00362EF113
MDNIRIFIVEDDLDWSKALVSFLNKQDAFFVAGVSASKNDALQQLQTAGTDIVLLDLNLSANELDGLEVAKQISLICEAKIIVLTAMSEEGLALKSFDSGAIHFVSKANYKELPDLIRSVHNQTSPIEIFLQDYYRLKKEDQLKELTTSERQVYELVEQGFSQSQIVHILQKAKRTLKNQMNSIFKKLKVKNSKEALQKVGNYGHIKNKEESRTSIN